MAGGCLMLALIHGVIWCRNRNRWESFWLSMATFGVIGILACEQVTMFADSPAVFERGVWWAHLDFLLVFLGVLGFVHAYFGTGSRWLFGLAIGTRLLAMIANSTTGSSLHFIAIHRLEKIPFLGQQVSVVADWEANPWVILGQISSLLWLIYVVDASVRLWRKGTPEARRRALGVGGLVIFFILFAVGIPGLVAAGLIHIPMNTSAAFIGMILVMNYELGGDVLRSARLSQDLKLSRSHMEFAEDVSDLDFWILDMERNEIVVTAKGREIMGLAESEELTFERFTQAVYPADLPRVQQAVQASFVNGGDFHSEHRVQAHPESPIRWMLARGQVDFSPDGSPMRIRGVTIEVTERKQTDARIEIQKQELAHLSRVNQLGELAGTLAHELSQPLTAMLNNSQVGSRSLKAGTPDMIEMAAILDDIAADAKRAGGVIHGMKAMLKKGGPTEIGDLDLNGVVQEVLSLLKSEIIHRKLEVTLVPDSDLPSIRASRVEIQQVLINLIVNGLDAGIANPEADHLEITTSHRDGWVTLSVRDFGTGIAAADLPRLFDSFFSTKPDGLGLGLAISRSITERFAGELLASNHPEGGAEFRLRLPVANDSPDSCVAPATSI